jgi:DNA/RNA endonuclease G (NUC1)
MTARCKSSGLHEKPREGIMRNRNASRWLVAAAISLVASIATAQNAVRISELHYDNAGTDAGEAIEISAPAGTDLTGWQVVLYNGTGGASYNTQTLSGVVPATCDARGVVVINYPANGIQNGSPDGIALVEPIGSVVEFLSYEGVFAATNGPANAQPSIDIGVAEAGTEPAGQSLARNAAGTWSGPAASTFGTCNDNGNTPPPSDVATISIAPASASVTVGATLPFQATALDASGQPIAATSFTWSSANPAVATVSAAGIATGLAEGDTTVTGTAANGVSGAASLHVALSPPPGGSDFHVNEIHYDNAGPDAGEAIEIEGPAGSDLTGFSVVLYNGNGGVPYDTQALAGVLPATCGARGVVVVNYPADGIQNGPDGIALVDSAGQLLEFVSYEGVFPAASGPAAPRTSTDIGVSQSSAPVGASLQRGSSGAWAAGASSFGACNIDGPPPGGANHLTFTGRLASDPPLPVGFEDQLFATLRDATNAAIPATITWSSDTPAVASIDAKGVMHALVEGRATIRATADDGTVGTLTLPTRVAVAGGTAQYTGNTEFGEPTDGDPSDDYIVRYEQYTSSYNPNRGSPNWVAYDLDASHFGAEDRCDCFTMDPLLPSTFTHVFTSDYTDAGTFAGYGIDRGHLARSFDRTTGGLDNARTYLFDNIVPQASDQNQGPWALLENYLGDLARSANREVYVIAGASGDKGTLKNEGKVVIPAYTWKVALVLPRDQGLASIHDYRDVIETVAVIMPNESGVRNVPWETYRTTVDAVEALSGYDLLTLLPDAAEAAVESGTRPPLAAATGPGAAIAEGAMATFDAAGSLDPNGTIVSYAWDFGDGATGSGVTAGHVYPQDGAYTARLTVTDNDGLTAMIAVDVTVTNVAPVVAAVPDATVETGAAQTTAGTFADPGADAWTATIDWGDGSAPTTMTLTSRSYSALHTFTAAGLYQVTVTIADDDGATSGTHWVTVTKPVPALAAALPLIDQMVAAGRITPAAGAVLKAEVVAAQRLIGRGNNPAAAVVLRTLLTEIDLLVRLRVVAAADVAPLRAVVTAALQAMG